MLWYTDSMKYRTTTELGNLAVAMYQTQKSLDEIATITGYKRSVITRLLRERGIIIRRRGKVQKYFLVNGEKECGRCHKVKSATEFSLHSDTHDGLQSRCRQCQNETVRNYRLWTKFGITEDDYNAMEQSQSGVCAICGQPETRLKFGKTTKLAVDHNHETGEIRELICFRCNVVMGRIEENTDLCDKIKAYLLKHNGGQPNGHSVSSR